MNTISKSISLYKLAKLFIILLSLSYTAYCQVYAADKGLDGIYEYTDGSNSSNTEYVDQLLNSAKQTIDFVAVVGIDTGKKGGSTAGKKIADIFLVTSKEQWVSSEGKIQGVNVIAEEPLTTIERNNYNNEADRINAANDLIHQRLASQELVTVAEIQDILGDNIVLNSENSYALEHRLNLIDIGGVTSDGLTMILQKDLVFESKGVAGSVPNEVEIQDGKSSYTYPISGVTPDQIIVSVGKFISNTRTLLLNVRDVNLFCDDKPPSGSITPMSLFTNTNKSNDGRGDASGSKWYQPKTWSPEVKIIGGVTIGAGTIWGSIRVYKFGNRLFTNYNHENIARERRLAERNDQRLQAPDNNRDQQMNNDNLQGRNSIKEESDNNECFRFLVGNKDNPQNIINFLKENKSTQNNNINKVINAKGQTLIMFALEWEYHASVIEYLFEASYPTNDNITSSADRFHINIIQYLITVQTKADEKKDENRKMLLNRYIDRVADAPKPANHERITKFESKIKSFLYDKIIVKVGKYNAITNEGDRLAYRWRELDRVLRGVEQRLNNGQKIENDAKISPFYKDLTDIFPGLDYENILLRLEELMRDTSTVSDELIMKLIDLGHGEYKTIHIQELQEYCLQNAINYALVLEALQRQKGYDGYYYIHDVAAVLDFTQ